MDPGYRSPLIDMFRRDGNRETRLLAAQGDLGAGAHDQLALLMMLIDDADPDVAMTALSTVQRLPLEPLRAFLARADVPAEIREYFAAMGITPADVAAPDASAPLTGDEDDDEDEEQGEAKEGGQGGVEASRRAADQEEDQAGLEGHARTAGPTHPRPEQAGRRGRAEQPEADRCRG